MNKLTLVQEETKYRFFKIILISTLVIFFSQTVYSKTHVVKITSDKFTPEHLEVAVGDTVIWLNKTGDYHTSTSGVNCNPDGVWNSGIIENGKQFIHVFKKIGSFPYFCIPHCRFGMKGLIIVIDANKSKEKKATNAVSPSNLKGELILSPKINRVYRKYIIKLNSVPLRMA